MGYIAHIRSSDNETQSVETHLLNVKKMAEGFGEKIGVKHIAGLAGMLHDLGKFTDEFREYLLEAVQNPSSPPKRGSVDHSTAGGKLLYETFHTKKDFKALLAEIVGNVIISHHSYLQDYLNPNLESNYLKRVRDKQLNEFEKSKKLFFKKVISEEDFHRYVDMATHELGKFLQKNPNGQIETKIMFLTKFVFSALIDADRTDARLFEEKRNELFIKNDNKTLFKHYYLKLVNYLNTLSRGGSSHSQINQLRGKMSEQCDSFAENPSGIYKLSIPTGGGKTLASLRYALKHAILYNKERIIYVIPYTTIIEQNAEEVRNILDDKGENILEHHSNVVDDSDDTENFDGFVDDKQKLQLAKDNWDAPIIFTTLVQFLNVFYADGSRNIRRLHNLANTVIIFDEVQKVPVSCVSLFNKALNFLKNYCHCSLILCTATQPALDYVDHKLDIEERSEIINNIDSVIKAFKRVEIIDRATNEKFDNEKLKRFILEKIEEVQNVLVILNTKAVVKKLYEMIKDETTISVFHLSTSMCAAHRKEVLNEIREKLDKKEKIICISTQLIEAGVDVSFHCVIRSLAGLDSLAQAAGRCNRNGESKIQYVYVIDHMEENLDKLKEIRVGKEIAKRILIDLKSNPLSHGGDILSREAMDRYFKEFYSELASEQNYYISRLDKYMIELLTAEKKNYDYYKAYCVKNKEGLPLFIVNSYKTAAEHFKVIDNETTPVIVPYKEGKELIAELNSYNTIQEYTDFFKKAQQFTINLYSQEYKLLQQNDGIVSYKDGNILVLKESAYDPEYGLNVNNDSALGTLIF